MRMFPRPDAASRSDHDFRLRVRASAMLTIADVGEHVVPVPAGGAGTDDVYASRVNGTGSVALSGDLESALNKAVMAAGPSA